MIASPFAFLYADEAQLAGPGTLADLVADLGFRGAAVACVYHRARLWMPRYATVRVTAPGHFAFAPEPSRYGELVPWRTVDGQAIDALHAFRSACRERGLGFHAWVVALHHDMLAQRHPAAAARTLDGGLTGHSLCPSSPATLAYCTALVADVCEQLEPDAIVLEAALYPAWEPSYNLTIALDEVPSRATALASQCFCESCRGRLAARGDDPDVLLAAVRASAGPPYDRQVGHDDDALAAITEMRAERVGELIVAVAREAKSHGAKLFPAAFGDPQDVRLQGLAPASTAAADGVVLGCFELEGAELVRHFAALRALAGDLPAVPSTNWSVRRSRFAADVRELRETGADGLAVYNLSLCSERGLAEIERALEAA